MLTVEMRLKAFSEDVRSNTSDKTFQTKRNFVSDAIKRTRFFQFALFL